MSDRPWLRQLYDGAERRIAPPLEQFVRTDLFADLTATLGQVQGVVTGGLRGVTTRFWHLVNLPAGTDVQRLRLQVGELDREVRRLTLQLSLREAKAQTGSPTISESSPAVPAVKVDEDADPKDSDPQDSDPQDSDTAQPVRRSRPRAPRGGAQHPSGS